MTRAAIPKAVLFRSAQSQILDHRESVLLLCVKCRAHARFRVVKVEAEYY